MKDKLRWMKNKLKEIISDPFFIVVVVCFLLPAALVYHWFMSIKIWDAVCDNDLPAVRRITFMDPFAVNAMDDDFFGYVINAALQPESKHIAAFLIEHGANVNAREMGGKRPLHFAAESDDWNSVRLLLDRHADVNASDGSKVTPLHLASESAGMKVVSMLLEAGANPNARDDCGETPVAYALARGRKRIVEILRIHGATERLEPILEAAALGDVETVRKELKHNSKLITHRSKRGWSALDYAASGDRGDVVDLLLRSGDTASYDSVGNAVASGSMDSMSVFLRHNIDINYIPKDRYSTYLQTAVMSGRMPMVKLLLNAGANVTMEGRDGMTALEFADAYGYDRIARVLRSAAKRKAVNTTR